jgi:hypothetical protein
MDFWYINTVNLKLAHMPPTPICAAVLLKMYIRLSSCRWRPAFRPQISHAGCRSPSSVAVISTAEGGQGERFFAQGKLNAMALIPDLRPDDFLSGLRLASSGMTDELLISTLS